MARKRSVGLAWRHGPESHRTQVKTVFAPQQQLGAFDHGLAACSDVGEPLQLRLDCSHALQSLPASPSLPLSPSPPLSLSPSGLSG